MTKPSCPECATNNTRFIVCVKIPNYDDEGLIAQDLHQCKKCKMVFTE